MAQFYLLILDSSNNGIGGIILLLIILSIWLYYRLYKAIRLYRKLDQKHAETQDRLRLLIGERDKLRSENSKLIADNAYLEAEHLKFQLQPHTLGNMVMAIKSISKNLYKGIESMAETVNYVLYKGNTHTVSISDEITFIRSYIELNSFLYPDVVSVKFDEVQVDKTNRYYKEPCIPHLITAYLIENAFKHGNKTHPDFLSIRLRLYDDEFEISTTNKIKSAQASTKADSTNGGIGLKNMEKRLELLMGGRYEIKRDTDEETYQVTLKLKLL